MLTKTDALQSLQAERTAVEALISQLTADEMARPNTIRHALYPGQEMSFKDLLAHLTMWDVIGMELLADWQQGNRHWTADPTQMTYEAGRDLNLQGVEKSRALSLEAVMQAWRETHLAKEVAFAALTDADWEQPAPFPTNPPTTLGNFLRDELTAPRQAPFRHVTSHVPDSAAYLEQVRMLTA